MTAPVSRLVVRRAPDDQPASRDWWRKATEAASADGVDLIGGGPDSPDPHVQQYPDWQTWRSATQPGGVVAILREGIALPTLWIERLVRALSLSPDIVAASATSANPEFLPLAPEHALAGRPDVDTLDALIYALGDRRVADIDGLNTDCAAIQAELLPHLPIEDWVANWKERGLRSVVLDHLWVGDPVPGQKGTPRREDPDHPAPAHPLATLRERLQAAGSGLPTSPIRPGLDGRPVQLHVTHSWGGGVERWCRDYAAADSERCHLFLVASGDPHAHRHGQHLTLHLGTIDGPTVRRWPLPDPIDSTAVEHAAWRAAFTETLATFCVDHMIVSSLVGHSVAALDTDLPTTVVLHDYYPAWPLLDEWFESHDRDLTPAYLSERLDNAGGSALLDDKSTTGWIELRDAWIQALNRPHVTVAAPHPSVVTNLQRIDERFGQLDIQIIPHGSPTMPRVSPSLHQRLRVVTLGRIMPTKGEDLIADALTGLSDFCDLYLVGCGRGGVRFLGRRNVHLVFEYRHEDLPGLITSIAPTAGLLLSHVSETWSYTLTEMWSLGVIPVATRAGSLGARIRPGHDGLLIDADPRALVDSLRQLAEDSELVQSLREGLPSPTRTPSAMVTDYHALTPSPEVAVARYPLADVDADWLQQLAGDDRGARRRESLARKQAEAAEQREELGRRARWGAKLQQRLQERTAWASSLADELQREQAQAQRIIRAHEETQRDLGNAVKQLRELHATVDERTRWAQQLDHTIGLMRRSRSWRLTRPLRGAAQLARKVTGEGESSYRRVRYLAGRTRNSLRVRGLGGTLTRIQDELKSRHEPLAPVAPAPVEDRGQAIVFERPSSPTASVVVPVYNKFELTRRCLLSLMEDGGETSFEVIVVDDASNDETPARLSETSGVTIVTHAQNQGFVGACNSGAAAAEGEYLVFLNNDTTVASGWLDALLETFHTHPDTGLAGAKLVYPDGRLQEAGGIVFADASGWNYGKFEDADHPRYNYVREADYCSGAAIALRRELFNDLNGFDLRYAPAYYEDTDLAFQVRAQGNKVRYQPASVVVHHEGATAGTDTAAGMKRHQVTNQTTFADKWADALLEQPRPGMPVERACEHRVNARVLMIDATLPSPDKDSGSVRLVNLVRLLIDRGLKVTMFAHNRVAPEPYASDLRRLGVEVWSAPWLDAPENFLAAHGHLYDWVFVSRHYVAREYLRAVRRHCPRARFIFDTVDLHYLREERRATLTDDAAATRSASATRQSELELVQQADVTVVVGDYEAELLRNEVPRARIEVLSNIHRVVRDTPDFAEREDIYFVGGYQHPPNVDAVIWFVAEIWPRIRARLPDLRFRIVGSHAPAAVSQLSGDGVEYVGWAPEMTPYLQGCRLSVAPLRYGAGVKGKINAAMAHGQPVVATPPAVEGMALRNEVDVLIAEHAESFADAVARLYQDEALWRRLAAGGYANVERHFSFQAAERAVEQIFNLDAGR